jgi:hypothetical protein
MTITLKQPDSATDRLAALPRETGGLAPAGKAPPLHSKDIVQKMQ